jgi:hypothetical protein
MKGELRWRGAYSISIFFVKAKSYEAIGTNI